MKAIKKIMAVVVALSVVLACAVFSVSAAEPTGSITIQNPSHSDATVAGKTFNVYKIFNATTSGTNTSYSWYEDQNGDIPFEDFFFGADGDEFNYMNKDSGTVQEVVEKIATIGVGGSNPNNFELSQFAEQLHQYIEKKGISTFIAPVEVAPTATVATIPNLPYGYYLVYDDTELTGDNASAVRSAVMLSTVNKDAVITLKANRPQILKQVEENDGRFGKGTSVSIGETVTFKITTEVPSHSLYTHYTYYVEDVMHDGLELVDGSIKVYYGDDLLTETDDYTLTPANGDVDFKVDFTASMNEQGKFATGEMLTIEYDAKVTDGIEARKANKNTAKLTYSNDPTDDDSTGSVTDSANVYSYQFVFTKFAEDTTGVLTNVRLAGAEFELYRVEEGQPDALVTFDTKDVTVTEGENTITYKQYIVAEGNTGAENVLKTHNEGAATITLSSLNMGGHLGDVSIFGLAEGKYKLVETKAPDGYVLPAAPFEIEIVDTIGELGSVAVLNVTGSHKAGDAGSIVNTNGIADGVLTVWAEITNKPGSALPETGGMGTTLFTVLGIILMVGAVAFFTSRKRSSVA